MKNEEYTVYTITFEIKGCPYSCTGTSTHPTKQQYEDGECISDVIETNIESFIRKYKEDYLGINSNTSHFVLDCKLTFPE